MYEVIKLIKNAIKGQWYLFASFAIVLFFFAPLDFYYSVKDDVWYDVYNILPGVIATTAIVALTTAVILLIVSILFSKIGKVNEYTRFVVFYLLIAFYVQGTFILIPYGALNGTPIVWNEYRLYDVLSIVVWFAILVLLLYFKKKDSKERFELIEKCVSIGLIIVAFVTLAIEFLIFDGNEYKYNKCSTVRNEWLYSTNTNFNILLLDCFDSRVFTDLLRENEEFKEMTETLDGFTFYRDSLGCYNLTDYAIPNILTGELYLAQSQYGEFVDTAYSEAPFLTKMEQDGWNKNIYTKITLPQGKGAEMLDNLSKVRLTSLYPRKFIADFYKTVAFKYMPTPLKKYFYNSFVEAGANKQSDLMSSETNDAPYDWNSVQWYCDLYENGIELTDNKMFHFYHLQGIHAPRQYHSDFSFTTDPTEVSLEESGVLSMKIATQWIEYLKEIGIYDNSVIIIMGDHGSWEYEAEGNYAQSPLLLVKGIGEHHSLNVSNLPISYMDLQEGFVNLLEYEEAEKMFKNVQREIAGSNIENFLQSWEELADSEEQGVNSVGRYRYFYFTYLMNEMGTNSKGGPFYEGITDLPAYCENGIQSTGYEYK